MINQTQTPMEELYTRIEKLRYAVNVVDELLKIKDAMLEKEHECIQEAYDQGHTDGMELTYGGNK